MIEQSVEGSVNNTTATLQGKQGPYLLSPFEGSPMLSNGSTFTDFNRLHGPEGVRPPRDDIDNRRS
jgi:hypothetical protein